jgi:hypothetical protein
MIDKVYEHNVKKQRKSNLDACTKMSTLIGTHASTKVAFEQVAR